MLRILSVVCLLHRKKEGGFSSCRRVVQGRDGLAVAGGGVGAGARRAPLHQHGAAARVAAVAHQKGEIE